MSAQYLAQEIMFKAHIVYLKIYQISLSFTTRVSCVGIGIPHFIVESDGSPVGELGALTPPSGIDQNSSSQNTPILSTPTHDVSSPVSQLLANQKLPALDEVI